MRGMLLSAFLMIIAAVIMGCGDSIVPCAEDAECVIEGHDVGMVCNLEVSPQERCDELFGWMEGLPIPIPIPDCAAMSTDPGVCELPLDIPI
jgi:hypothetical protein